MKISDVKGIAAAAPRSRQDAVVATANAPDAAHAKFQARLTVASRFVQEPGAPAQAGATGRSLTHQNAGRRCRARADAAMPQRARHAAVRSDTRAAAQANRHAPATPGRLRRFRRLTQKQLRERLFKRVADMGLEFLDAWTDAAARRVTVIVDHPGFAPTRFDVECQDSTWQVTICAASSDDAERFLHERDPLQRRFAAAGLGAVSVVTPDQALTTSGENHRK